MRAPQAQGNIGLRAPQAHAHIPELGCAHSRHMRASQAQGRIGLRAMRELQQQSEKKGSAGLAAVTPEAHVSSGNLSYIL